MAETLTPRMKALQNLQAQLPAANQQVAAGQQAARNIQLQNAVKSAPTAAPIASTAQQTGAASAAQAGQQSVERVQNSVQQTGQLGQLGLGEQKLASESRVSGLQLGAKEQAMDNVQRLAKINEDAKQELYDKQMQFERDEAGRTLFNERQLADYAKSSALSDEQLKDYAQQTDQLSKRKLEAMEHAAKLVDSDLSQKYSVAKQKGDQQMILQINQMRRDMEEKIRSEKAKAANRSAAFTAGGTIIGGVAGAFVGGPAGASMGASAGGALGGAAASQTE